MKKQICVLLAVLMMITLAACGEKGSAKEETPSVPKEEPARIEFGKSAIYTQEELEKAVDKINVEFASWKGCVLHSLRYAGDEANREENLNWLNSLREGAGFTQVAEFLMDFHSPKEGQNAWELDTEYTDYQWWLARNGTGDWEVVSWGYGGGVIDESVEDMQNPVMNFIGYYGPGRPTIFVECEGTDGARINVHWSSSAWENSEWTMSGKLDTDTLTVEYEDAVRTDRVYSDSGEISSETVIYENGTGRFIFNQDGSLTWMDDIEHMADGIPMPYNPELRPPES